MKILIVDDEKLITDGLKVMMQKISKEDDIICTNSSLKAIELFEKEIPDVVITDICMPNLDGLELLKTLRKKHKFKSIVISSYDEFDYIKTSIQLESTNYLLKPVDQEELLSTIEKIKKDRIEEQLIESFYTKSSQPILFNNLMTRLLKKGLANQREEDLNKIKELFPASINYQLIYFKVGTQKKEIFNQIVSFCETLPLSTKTVITENNDILTIFNKNELENYQDKIANLKKIKTHVLLSPEFDFDYLPTVVTMTNNLLTNFEEVNMTLPFISFQEEMLTKVDISLFLGEELDAKASYSSFTLLYILSQKLFKRNHQATLNETSQLILKSDLTSKKVLSNLISVLDKEKSISFSPVIYKVLEIGKQKINIHYSLKELGEMLNVNSAYLGQLFLKEVGTSYTQYFQKKRMELANKMIRQNELKIGDIAKNLGYEDISLFYRHYKKEYNQTPNKVRLELN